MTTPGGSASQNPISTLPSPTTLPSTAFDFLPDLHALIQRVANDELDAKDIAHESSRIRLKIQRARAMVAELPKVDKSLEEERKEIRELEERIARQKEMISSLKDMEVVQEVVRRKGGGERMEVDS
ncbi:hypothetical protein RUND412_006517 [Rhizina undulata]